MRKERYLVYRRNKLLPRGDGPFQVVERINDKAYKLDLSGEYGVHVTFNVTDLSPNLADDEFDLKKNCLQKGGNDDGSMADRAPQGWDVPSSSSDIQLIPRGLITRAHAKKLRS